MVSKHEMCKKSSLKNVFRKINIFVQWFILDSIFVDFIFSLFILPLKMYNGDAFYTYTYLKQCVCLCLILVFMMHIFYLLISIFYLLLSILSSSSIYIKKTCMFVLLFVLYAFINHWSDCNEMLHSCCVHPQKGL
jgi:hypothetical protein